MTAGVLDSPAAKSLLEALRWKFPDLDPQTCDRKLARFFQYAAAHAHLLTEPKDPKVCWRTVLNGIKTSGNNPAVWMRRLRPLAADELACRSILARTIWFTDKIQVKSKTMGYPPSATAIAVDAYIAAIQADPRGSDYDVRRNMLERFASIVSTEIGT